MEVSEDLASALRQTVNALRETQEELHRANARPTRNQVGTSHVNVDGGGFFAVLILFVSAITLGVALATCWNVSSRMTTLEQRQDGQHDQLDAIYMIAPQLKPKDSSHVNP